MPPPVRALPRLLQLSVAAVLTACAAAAPPPGGDDGASLVYRGSVDLPEAPDELSGITHVEGSRYLAVANTGNRLATLRVETDDSGATTAASVEKVDRLPGPVRDYEGIAWAKARGSIFLSEETQTLVHEFTLAPLAEAQGSRPTRPTAFDHARPNRRLESLTLSPDGGTLYTANEEALALDGPTATPLGGTTVRIVRFTVAGDAPGAGVAEAAQFRYDVGKVPGSHVVNPVVPAIAGLSDLVALPDGRLLALERSLRMAPPMLPAFQARVYLVDLAGATPLPDPALPVTHATNTGTPPLRKTLLWAGPVVNLEGLALGPATPTGYTLLGVSDSQGRRVGPVLHSFHLVLPAPR